MEPELDPHMEALGRRAFVSWNKVMGIEPKQFASLSYKERAAWTQAARDAGQNFPAPMIVEVCLRGPRPLEAEPVKAVFMGEDTQDGAKDIVRQFTNFVNDHLMFGKR